MAGGGTINQITDKLAARFADRDVGGMRTAAKIQVAGEKPGRLERERGLEIKRFGEGADTKFSF
jgi:hypothetical protein